MKRLVGEREAPGHEWALVTELDHAEFLLNEEEKSRRARIRSLKNVSEVDAQCEAHRLVAQQLREQSCQARLEMDRDVARKREEVEAEKARALDRGKRFNDDSKRHVEITRQRQREERNSELRADHEMTRKAQEEAVRDEALQEQRRAANREMMRKIAEDEKLNASIKAQHQREESQRDLRMFQQHTEMLELKERQKTEELQRRKDKQQKLLDQYEAGVGNELARLQAQDELRASQEQTARTRKELQQAERKEERLRQMEESGKAAIRVQLDARAERRRHERDENMQLGLRLREDAACYEFEERTKQQRRTELCEANAEQVRKQIVNRSLNKPVAEDAMTELERALNRKTIERARDPTRSDGLQLVLKKKKMEYRMAGAE